MFEVRGDDMVALIQHTLDRYVEGIGAVECEDPVFRLSAIEELIEPVPAFIQLVFRGESHLVPRPTGIGQQRMYWREVVESGIDPLGLRETRGGVIEVDHGGSVQGRVSSFERQPSLGHISRYRFAPNYREKLSWG